MLGLKMNIIPTPQEKFKQRKKTYKLAAALLNVSLLLSSTLQLFTLNDGLWHWTQARTAAAESRQHQKAL